MKESACECNEDNSYINYDDELIISKSELSIKNSEKFDDLCRKLTSTDVDQALFTLKINPNASPQQTISSDNEISTMLYEQEYDCCRLLRSNTSSRSFLPLARRGRSFFSTRSHRLLCSNCTKIKHQQELDILQNSQEKFHSNHTYQITINLDLSSDEQLALNNHQYQSSQTLVWNINTSNRNLIDISYDTGSLSDNEKKILLDETIKKLQMILNNRSTTLMENNPELTYRILQTTINILSSSQNSI
ncbi:unnamed protein product [Rotaria sordida]|uniref:Uncharacterized protein n=1 Tax=Rotaria sordida TaxID=392033 RepID=A0A814F2D6_9BILA|nr:unnamed protein product [Rotaria sordida]CAF1173390.1 unnamed protein product [Rotaria sordida]CAF1189674.1 unnamed protein product [Rotaria sordida]CAF1200408.1 unnamed protein product [Rotaria sordida]CAF1211763.1 unnamed protein product [Rotaria sordida]